MNIKEELLKIKNKLEEVKEDIKQENYTVNNYSIDKKVDLFMRWYYKNFVKNCYTNTCQYLKLREMLNTIEKMAVWYELRYPDNAIYEKFLGNSDESPWEKELSPKAFLNTLTWEEKKILLKPRYSKVVYVNGRNHLHLTTKGRVSETEIIKKFENRQLEYYDFNGWHVSEVLDYLNSINYPIKKNDIYEEMQNYKLQSELKESFLDIVMYRIIDRGGVRYAPKRAFLFAKEFNRDIDIPMTYGVERNDPNLISFINEYIKAGGHKDLMCILCYDGRKSEKDPLKVISIENVLKDICPSYLEMNTNNEVLIYKNLLNELDIDITNEEIQSDEFIDNEKQKTLSRI